MAAKIPAAGRPRQVPGSAVPPQAPGQLSGSMRDRAGADKPVNLVPKAVLSPKARTPKRRRKA